MSQLEIDTGTSSLLASRSGAALVVTLNRPEARNAMTSAMIGALGNVLADAEVEPAVKCIV